MKHFFTIALLGGVIVTTPGLSTGIEIDFEAAAELAGRFGGKTWEAESYMRELESQASTRKGTFFDLERSVVEAQVKKYRDFFNFYNNFGDLILLVKNLVETTVPPLKHFDSYRKEWKSYGSPASLATLFMSRTFQEGYTVTFLKIGDRVRAFRENDDIMTLTGDKSYVPHPKRSQQPSFDPFEAYNKEIAGALAPLLHCNVLKDDLEKVQKSEQEWINFQVFARSRYDHLGRKIEKLQRQQKKLFKQLQKARQKLQRSKSSGREPSPSLESRGFPTYRFVLLSDPVEDIQAGEKRKRQETGGMIEESEWKRQKTDGEKGIENLETKAQTSLRKLGKAKGEHALLSGIVAFLDDLCAHISPIAQ